MHELYTPPRVCANVTGNGSRANVSVRDKGPVHQRSEKTADMTAALASGGSAKRRLRREVGRRIGGCDISSPEWFWAELCSRSRHRRLHRRADRSRRRVRRGSISRLPYYGCRRRWRWRHRAAPGPCRQHESADHHFVTHGLKPARGEEGRPAARRDVG